MNENLLTTKINKIYNKNILNLLIEKVIKFRFFISFI